MACGLKGDIQKLAKDNQRLKSELDKLEQDHSAWAFRGEEKDLKDIISCLKRLEADVSVMASDCSLSARRHDGNGFQQDLHHAYVHINALFEDVKKARNDLQRAYIYPKELNRMEIDWGRLKKTLVEIAEHLEN